MNKLITECVELVNDSSLSFAIGGGYALELFIDKVIRPHSDLDICVFENDKVHFIKFMLDHGWIIYEPLNQRINSSYTGPSCTEGRTNLRILHQTRLFLPQNASARKRPV